MKLKNKDVNINGLELVMRKALIASDKIWRAHGKELVITSARDGVHNAFSLHPFGLAIDLRTRYFTSEQKKQITKQLKNELKEFDVVLEKTHLHIEYDNE